MSSEFIDNFYSSEETLSKNKVSSAANVSFRAASSSESQVGISRRGRTRPKNDRHIRVNNRGRRIWVPKQSAAKISHLTRQLGHSTETQTIEWLLGLVESNTGTITVRPISISAAVIPVASAGASASSPTSLSTNSAGMQQQRGPLAQPPTAGYFPAEMVPLPPTAGYLPAEMVPPPPPTPTAGYFPAEMVPPPSPTPTAGYFLAGYFPTEMVPPPPPTQTMGYFPAEMVPPPPPTFGMDDIFGAGDLNMPMMSMVLQQLEDEEEYLNFLSI